MDRLSSPEGEGEPETLSPPTRLTKNKTQKAHPAPTTKRAKDSALKTKVRNIYKKLANKKRTPSYLDILNHKDFKFAIEDSGHEKTYLPPQKTIQNWLTEFRQTT